VTSSFGFKCQTRYWLQGFFGQTLRCFNHKSGASREGATLADPEANGGEEDFQKRSRQAIGRLILQQLPAAACIEVQSSQFVEDCGQQDGARQVRQSPANFENSHALLLLLISLRHHPNMSLADHIAYPGNGSKLDCSMTLWFRQFLMEGKKKNVNSTSSEGWPRTA